MTGIAVPLEELVVPYLAGVRDALKGGSFTLPSLSPTELAAIAPGFPNVAPLDGISEENYESAVRDGAVSLQQRNLIVMQDDGSIRRTEELDLLMLVRHMPSRILLLESVARDRVVSYMYGLAGQVFLEERVLPEGTHEFAAHSPSGALVNVIALANPQDRPGVDGELRVIRGTIDEPPWHDLEPFETALRIAVSSWGVDHPFDEFRTTLLTTESGKIYALTEGTAAGRVTAGLLPLSTNTLPMFLARLMGINDEDAETVSSRTLGGL